MSERSVSQPLSVKDLLSMVNRVQVVCPNIGRQTMERIYFDRRHQTYLNVTTLNFVGDRRFLQNIHTKPDEHAQVGAVACRWHEGKPLTTT